MHRVYIQGWYHSGKLAVFENLQHAREPCRFVGRIVVRKFVEGERKGTGI